MSAPVSPRPQGNYLPASRWGNLVISAGMTPRLNGQLLLTGPVLPDRPLDFYREAVRQAAANALTACRNFADQGQHVGQLLCMTVYINTAPGFFAHTALADFASDYLCEQLGELGIVSRAAVGVASLPGDAPVEIQLIAGLAPDK